MLLRSRKFLLLLTVDVILFVCLVACSFWDSNYAEIPMNWRPVDSLNVHLPEGIRLYSGSNNSLPLRAWYVRIDEKHPDIYTKVVVSDDTSDNRETTSSFATDLGARVVINGGYFTMDRIPARHFGLLISEGKIISPATNSVIRNSIRYETARAAIGFLDEDKIDVSWVTTRGDTVYSWHAPPVNASGRPTKTLQYTKARIWKVRDAIGAGPALVINGKVHITSEEEVFFGTSIPKTHPRSAIGYTEDGTLILMVVDGRQENSRGVTLEELAGLVHSLNVLEAINLDGGGSATLVVNGTLINRPTGGTTEREVMSAIATLTKSKI